MRKTQQRTNNKINYEKNNNKKDHLKIMIIKEANICQITDNYFLKEEKNCPTKQNYFVNVI